MVFFEAGFQALQDLNGFLDAGFFDIDFLETARERVVFLEHAAKFCIRGRTDTLKITRCQHRFDQVGCIHDAAGRRTGADDGVDFIDEQDCALAFFQLTQHTLEAFFEITAVLGASDECAEVE